MGIFILLQGNCVRASRKFQTSSCVLCSQYDLLGISHVYYQGKNNYLLKVFMTLNQLVLKLKSSIKPTGIILLYFSVYQ